MANSEITISTCATCGHTWRAGTDGSHVCPIRLTKQVEKLTEEIEGKDRVIKLLLIAGHLDEGRLDQAIELSGH